MGNLSEASHEGLRWRIQDFPDQRWRCQPIITARNPRMGEVMFSQACVYPQEGYLSPRSQINFGDWCPSLWSKVLSGGIPVSGPRSFPPDGAPVSGPRSFLGGTPVCGPWSFPRGGGSSKCASVLAIPVDSRPHEQKEQNLHYFVCFYQNQIVFKKKLSQESDLLFIPTLAVVPVFAL